MAKSSHGWIGDTEEVDDEKRYSTSLSVGVMQTQTSVGSHFAVATMAVTKKTDNRGCGTIWNPERLLVGVSNEAAALEKKHGGSSKD